ncbi:flotillin family protein [Pseudodesulfovibrio sp.]|uniref:flotillin family protein n=1 Tax=Pseudodesulfovibrio sp. TaxID=2035812 RepID=UPI0026169B38|nr:flotillin family protein [Pseudodesulfovibrio sp.]MDD3310684.1 SPFH domain-containing protein [Pseudodesulfovibrio sp.]
MYYEISSLGLWALPIIAFIVLIVATLTFLASRYKRCPSDMILVVFGKVGEGQSAKCIHGGGAIIWPLIQDFSYMSLTPMTIAIPLQKALSLQNIRINVPSTFTVGISTEAGIMQNAAERLLNQTQQEIEDMAMEIIFGQLRLTVASLTIEQINQDRESFLESVRENVSPELNKIGLYLINVNITDITDESGYIDSIGKKAAAEAINQAKVDVAEQNKLGAIGEASANKEKDIRVAENVAQSEKGQKQAEADRRVFVQQQEATASIGEADANREMEIRVAENLAQAVKGKKKAEADQRIYVQAQEAEAIKGENTSKADIAQADADLHVKQAEAMQQGEVAKRKAEAEIQKAQYLAERERLNAEQVAVQEIEKRKIEIAAEAEAEKTRREAKGRADATLMQYEAEAKGIRQVLEGKAEGYRLLVESTGGDAKAAATMLLLEKIESIVETQVEAVKNLKIDKITVWDGGSGDGSSSTANFFSNIVKSLPPLQEITKMAGLELPEYLGRMKEEPAAKDEDEKE